MAGAKEWSSIFLASFPEAINCTKSISRILRKGINLLCIAICLIYGAYIRVGCKLNSVGDVQLEVS